MLKGKCVVLGVTGSIAAYKIAYLASIPLPGMPENERSAT